MRNDEPDPELYELIQRAVAGDRDALSAVLERCRERVTTITRCRLDGPARAKLHDEDIVNESLAYASQHLTGREFASSGAFLHWLSSIVASKVVDFTRRRDAQKRGGGCEALSFGGTTSTPGLSRFATGGTTPSQAAERAEILALLPEALERLPASERRAYELVRLCSMSTEEAAAAMNIGEGSVRAYLTHANAKIAAYLGLE